MTIYCALKASDPFAGKGQSIPIAYFQNKTAAALAAMGEGVMGKDGEVKEIQIYETFRDYEEDKKKELRTSAMAKLTREERRACGLEV